MRVAIGCDHYGYALKLTVVKWLEANSHEALDVGCRSVEPDEGLCDYADAVCKAVLGGGAERGILICGTGVAMNIRANRWPGIRATICQSAKDAKGARNNSNINVMVLEGNHCPVELAEQLLADFVDTPFEALERRVRRVAWLDAETRS